MDKFLVNYNQQKKERKGNFSNCQVRLSCDGKFIRLFLSVTSTYNRFNIPKSIGFNHTLELNIETGDFIIEYELKNDNAIPGNFFKNTYKVKKNNFISLENLTTNGIMKGEKKLNYWGVNYELTVNKLYNQLYTIFQNNFKNNFYLSKDYKNKPVINKFYDLIVDYHLDRKGIKGYDDVYYTIQYNYPKKKWLEKNDNKFISALLDEFGIKSKYLISKLNDPEIKILNLKSLKYICKLFGENYIDYIKKTPWENLCYDDVVNNKIFTLKNDSEKKYMIKLMNSWNDESITSESFVNSTNKLLSLRDELESMGYKLRFNPKTYNEFEYLFQTWKGLKIYKKRGYKLRYKFPIEFIEDIERNIVQNNNTFKIKILSTEDEYRLEGFKMKNCMSTQFVNGSIFIFISIEHKKTRINLQVKNGEPIQTYGKANTRTPVEFKGAIDILMERIKNYPDIKWEKEKYDNYKN